MSKSCQLEVYNKTEGSPISIDPHHTVWKVFHVTQFIFRLKAKDKVEDHAALALEVWCCRVHI
jgi:hypothetical protein